MSKRFTDTEKWKDDWYLSLSNDYKIVWQWLLDNCNHAGICKRSINVLNMMCKVNITENDLLEAMEDRIIICNKSWFIPNFIKFQYKTLQSNKPAVVSVVNELMRANCHLMIPPSFGANYIIISDDIIINNEAEIMSENHKQLNNNNLHNDKIIVVEQLHNDTDIIKDMDMDKVVFDIKKDDKKKSEKIGTSVIQKSNSEFLDEVKTYTHNDLLEFCAINYPDRMPNFKSMWSEVLYERYQKTVKLILFTYTNLRCNFMLTLPQFKQIGALHTDEEIEKGLAYLSERGQLTENGNFHLVLKSYIGYALEKENKNKNGDKGSNKREDFN